MFTFVFEYFWLIIILVTVVNWLIANQRIKGYIIENPAKEDGYRALLKGYLFWMNLPWIVMGVGSVLGGVPSVLHYFRPHDGDPYVLAWFLSIFTEWILGTVWLFVLDGAERLSQHPGIITYNVGFQRKDITSPWIIKLIWILSICSGIFGVYMMIRFDIQVPTLR